MASNTTWTWLRSLNYAGTTAVIVLPLAREYQLAQFRERFPNHEKYVRPVGVYWDGSTMSPDELDAYGKRPFQTF